MCFQISFRITLKKIYIVKKKKVFIENVKRFCFKLLNYYFTFLRLNVLKKYTINCLITLSVRYYIKV